MKPLVLNWVFYMANIPFIRFMGISTHLLAAIIGLVYPAYLLLTAKKSIDRIKVEDKYRLIDYKQTIFNFWLLTALILGNIFIDSSLVLNFYPSFDTIGLILAGLILIFILLQALGSRISTLEKARSTREKLKLDYHYLPKSKNEFIWFNALSVSAGICEEIIFRLFLFTYLAENTHLAVAFILTNLIFALTHIGSSKQNMLGAFILGLIFSGVYYFSDNIWLAIVLHSAIDINAGILGYYSHKHL